MKLRKILSAVMAAAMCVAMAGTVSADETKTDAATSAKTSFWQDAKEMTGAKYYPSLMKLAEKYYNKDQNRTISYGKSMTKKFYTKAAKALSGKTPQISMSECDGESVTALAMKGDMMSMVVADDTMLMAIYYDEDSTTMILGTEEAKGWMSEPYDSSESDSESEEAVDTSALDELTSSYSDSMKGKYFKIKYKEKIYIYEEFDGVGMLFTEKGTPLVEVSEGGTWSMRVTYKVDDSEFKPVIPDGYEEITE